MADSRASPRARTSELIERLQHLAALSIQTIFSALQFKVHYAVKVPKGKREDALRAIQVHEQGCPASQSVRRGIAIEWDGEVVEE
jgi:organic hydroperoxide reductase OsmC/OhrA